MRKSVLHHFDPAAVVGTTRGAIDSIDYVDGLPGLVVHPQPTVVPRGAPLIVSGWGVDPATDDTPQAVCLLINQARPHFARTGIARGDVRAEFRTGEFVGFQTVVPTDILDPGGHELRVHVLAGDGFWYESATFGIRVYDRVFPVAQAVERPLRLTVAAGIDMLSGRTIEPGEAVTADRWVAFRGWSVDLAMRRGAAGVVAFDETGRSWSGPANLERADVATAFGTADPRVGFEIAIPAAALGPGRHVLRIAGLDAAGRRYANAVDVVLDLVPATRPFPLTARVLNGTGAFQVRLCKCSDDGATAPISCFPAVGPIDVVRGTKLDIAGWALLDSGHPATEIFVELAHASAAIPPQRLATRAGRRRPDAPAAFARPPVEDSWFDCPFDTRNIPPSDYTIALICVRPGRTTVERTPLGTVRIVQGTRTAE